MSQTPPDKLLHNWLKQSASRFQLIESLPRLGGGWSANHQRIGMTGARQRCGVVVRGDRAERHSNPLLNQPVESRPPPLRLYF